MAGTEMAAIGALLTANGTAAGVVALATTAGWKVGTRAFISDDNSTHREVIVIEVTDATHLVVRFTSPVPNSPDQGPNLGYNGMNYGVADVSGFTTALNARIDAWKQFVYNA